MLGILTFSCIRSERRTSDGIVLARLQYLHDRELYFSLKDYFNLHNSRLSEKDRLFYTAIVKSSFNDQAASNEAIGKLLNGRHEEMSEYEMMYMHKTKFMNHYNLNEYRDAFQEGTLLIGNYTEIMDSVKYVQLLNDQKILQALRTSPAMEIIKHDDSRFGLKRDKVGLLNIMLNIDNDSINFLFDTGSSFSFISRSIAQKYNLQIFDINIEVEGATGTPVICDLALIDTFFIGNIEIRHAVFWVFDNKDLSLPEYDYYVNGALGFPIWKAVEEMQLISEDQLFIPKVPTPFEFMNLAMDDLDPIIAVIHEGDTLPCYFDTGAAFSSLYKPYYMENAAMIDTSYDQHSFTIGSLGGVKEFTCYIIDSILLEVAGSSAWIFDVETHTESIYKDAEKVYGNIGQDFINQFDKMIISIKYSSVVFE